jgi:glycosyltransferase 2 family protein
VTGRDRGRTPRAAATAIGAVIAIAGAVFVGVSLARDWPETRDVLAGMPLTFVAGAIVFALLGVILFGLCWHRALALFGLRTRRRDALAWFFVGQLGKYVPGGVWSVVGPSELAVGRGAERSRTYGAMLFTTGAIYLAALLTVGIALAFGPSNAREWAPAHGLLVLVPAGVLLLHPRILRWGLRFGERWTGRDLGAHVPRWRTSLLLVGQVLPAWVFIGISTWLLAIPLTADASVVDITAAAALAWTAGLLVVPAPGGLGVREAVFIVAVGSIPMGVAAAVALLSRLVFVAADALVALAMTPTLRDASTLGGPDGS